MASKGVLYIIISGPDSHQRAIEGLRMAEYQSGDGTHGVALMLQGEGVEWLRAVSYTHLTLPTIYSV